MTTHRKKLERGLLASLFPGKKYPDLTSEELRQYSREWKRQNSARVEAGILARREETNRRRRERFQTDPQFRAVRRAAEAEWRRTHPKRTAESYRKYRLKAEYGLTLEDYDAMLARQGGLCALCGGRPTKHWKKLVVDHDHKSGRVRGLLCHSCNMVLGHLRDDVSLMRRAIKYLQECERTALIARDESQKDSLNSGPLFLEGSAASRQ